MLTLSGVEKAYPIGEEEQLVLKGVDFTLYEGEFVAVLGPSGSGKSTLMNILGCLDMPTRGRYTLMGQEVSSLSERELARLRNREIGFVFQSFYLLPRLTALENVELPLTYAGVGRRQRREIAQGLLSRMGLENRMAHYPRQLSGGQQQRVAIARALSCRPSLLLADEPTGALDQHTGLQVMELFHDLHREGNTIVMITHNQDLAKTAQRVVNILDGRLSSGEALS
ncbi:ABC transporter ATP-binding protein [Christensenella sp. MSJ-20]|nr:ABC transporter ATP-binding protein [Christensenella sp. MSJ-20]